MANKLKEPKVKIGDRFGKLEVVKQIDMPIEKRVKDESGTTHKVPTGKTKIGYFCKCDCGGSIEITETTLLTERSSLRSCDKCPPVENPNYIPKDMTPQDVLEWEELYEYVKKNVLGYNESQKLSASSIMRLKGLTKGKFYAGKKTANNANYSYKTVLNTFKFCSQDINKVLKSTKLNGESHIINYIAKIIENNINNVYMRMKNVERIKEEAETIEINTAIYTGAEYQRKTKDMTNKLLEDLW